MSAKVKHFTRTEVLNAFKNSYSVMGAARFLGCSYKHFKKFAKLYRTDDGTQNLFDNFKNQAGKGVSKNGRKSYGDNTVPTKDILTGKVPINFFTYDQIKNRIIRDKILPPKCDVCGFCEKRDDFKMPLILNFKDGNIRNFRTENLQLLCYNHYFMTYHRLLVNEEHVPGFNTFNPEYDPNDSVGYSDDIQVDDEFEGIGDVDW